MSTVPTLPGITSQMVPTSRIQVHLLTSGPKEGAPVIFIHGNASSATFWEEIMLKLPAGYRGLRAKRTTAQKRFSAPLEDPARLGPPGKTEAARASLHRRTSIPAERGGKTI